MERGTITGPIGVFDSGYGGLTVLKKIQERLPDNDFLYLGDNARAPYGTRSFDIVYKFTTEAVSFLFSRGCSLVILACNTASAKALRNIQQNYLPVHYPERRVLGVIRPTVEHLDKITRNGNIGIFATPGTVTSGSYNLEIEKLFPAFKAYAHACPMWVPLVENNELEGEGADYFIKKEIQGLLSEHQDIDTVVLGCTHYPLLHKTISRHIPEGITVMEQGEIVAESLADYLSRHPEIDARCSRGGITTYLTTEDLEKFDSMASIFLGRQVSSQKISLSSI